MPPKMRFLAAQAEAMLTGGLWLKLAAHANAMAAQLSSVFSAASVDHAYPAQGNEVFVNLAPDQIASLRAQGAAFLEWTSGSCRFVCSWTTTEDEIRALGAALARR
jgi:threonine aldolase